MKNQRKILIKAENNQQGTLNIYLVIQGETHFILTRRYNLTLLELLNIFLSINRI